MLGKSRRTGNVQPRFVHLIFREDMQAARSSADMLSIIALRLYLPESSQSIGGRCKSEHWRAMDTVRRPA